MTDDRLQTLAEPLGLTVTDREGGGLHIVRVRSGETVWTTDTIAEAADWLTGYHAGYEDALRAIVARESERIAELEMPR